MGLTRLIATAVIAGVGVVPIAQAQPCEDYGRFTHRVARANLDGDFRGIDVVGPLAYLASLDQLYLPNLQIVDISDPLEPVLVGFLDTPGTAIDVEVVGSYAYLVGSDGLRVVDVSNPNLPTLGGVVALPGVFPRSIVVSGGYAFVSNLDAGLVVVDISDPAAPAIAGQLAFADDVTDLAIQGSYAYLANHRDLRVVDISNPTAPAVVGTVALHSSGYSASIDVAGDYAYVGTLSTDRGLYVVDVATPSAPAVVGSVTGFDGRTVVVDGNLVYTGSGTVRVIDVSVPTAPVHLLETNVQIANVSGKALALSGGYIFSADSDMDVGLKGDMEEPTPITTYSGDDTALECRLVGDTGFMTYHTDLNKRGVRRLDLSDPTNPLPLDNWDLPASHFPQALGASDDFVILTFYRLHDPDGFVVFDASGGGLMSESITYTADQPLFPTLSGDHAFITDYQALRVYDLSVPSAPSEVATVPLSSSGRAVLDGNLLYVPIVEGVQIIDVTNPASPILRGATSVPQFYGRDIALVDDRAYVAGEYGAVLLVDVSVPIAPAVLDEIAGDGTSIAVGVGIAFLTRPNYDVTVLDVSNPSAMSIAGVVYPFDDAPNVACGNGFIALPGESGLQIYPPPCTATAVGDTPHSPARVSLRSYPNPFNPRTTVSFEIPARDHLRLTVYDVSGREVAVLADRVFPAGMNEVEWDGRGHDGRSMASGVYFARLVAGELRAATKLILLK